MKYQVLISGGDIPMRLFDDWIEAVNWANKELDDPWYIKDTETGNLVWESSHYKKLYVFEIFEDEVWVPCAFHSSTNIRGMLDTWNPWPKLGRIRRVKTKQEAYELVGNPDHSFELVNLDHMEWAI